MKIRQGFVSNSSSSSFIIKSKKEKLTRSELLEIANIDVNSPLGFIADEFVKLVNETMIEDNKLSISDLEAEYVWDNRKTFEHQGELITFISEESPYSKDELHKVADNKFFIYESSVSDDDFYENMLGVYFCQHGFEFENDVISINCDPY